MIRNSTHDSHHPGPPRFMQVGEKIVDPIFVDMDHGFDRDNLAPSIAGDPRRDPDNYHPSDFEWSLVSKPADSDATVEYTPTPYDHATQYDSGLHNTADFQPDVPGTYVFELDAPDGTHRQTVEVFPAPPEGARGPPRLALDGHYDAEADAFVVEPDVELSPMSSAFPEDVDVIYRPHDAAGLSQADVEKNGRAARIPVDALDGVTRVFAAPYDGQLLGATDEIVFDPDAKTVELPNRPPDWLDDAVVYEIFTRSFAGELGETDFEFLTEKVAYLDELGVDVVWLTPIVPAWSVDVEKPPGGPHAYSSGDYFDVAEDLGTLAEYRQFVETCHDHDIKVLFDLVINHCGRTHPFFQDTITEHGPDPEDPYEFPDVETWNKTSKYFDWFDRQNEPTDHEAAPAATYFFGVRLQPNLNYGNVALREHILAAAEFWSDIVDGFRCDIAWGVPHSFWKELRDRVKRDDPDFLLLDEAIPRNPAFGESEFDMHFDTTGFMHAAHSVAAGERPASDLLDAIEGRQADGFPTYDRILNATENHDERRLYHEVKTNGRREDPAKAQRAAIAAAFTLPGIPFVFGGQERLISEHGTPRQTDYEGDDDVSDDPYKRALLNWEDYPDEHLDFYTDLIAYYHESDVLTPTAELVPAPYRADNPEDVLVFGRDNGEETQIVVVNFGSEPATVDLRLVVDTTDRFTGRDCERDGPDDATTVEVDTLAIFDTPAVLGNGRRP